MKLCLASHHIGSERPSRPHLYVIDQVVAWHANPKTLETLGSLSPPSGPYPGGVQS
jgi:hypothetical protein